MKKTEFPTQGQHWIYKCLPFALAVLTLLVTGCPHNEYLVELAPQGDSIERTLVFYRADNGSQPNYQKFDTNELANIIAWYPAHSLTNLNFGARYSVHGVFTNDLPADVGGAGTYSHLTTSLGDVGFYVERFRGNDDLAGMAERRFKAANRLADLVVGWSRMELGRQPGYDKLHQFLNVDFRRDLKNLGTYYWEGQLANGYKTNADEEFVVRFGQYLHERGYFTAGEIPELFRETTGNNPEALLLPIQRLVARKMGVLDTKPVPACLAFLANEKMIEESFDKYLASTELYRAELKQWKQDKKRNPKLKEPEPGDLAGNAFSDLGGLDSSQPDHLVVRLSLLSPPAQSNGRWDDAVKQVVWDTNIEGRTNATQLPFFCYASWAQADESFQKEHLGKVALIGDELTKYCLWRNSQDARRGGEWDAFLAHLQPAAGLGEKIASFRFSGEPNEAGTNGKQKITSPSAYPRELLDEALR